LSSLLARRHYFPILDEQGNQLWESVITGTQADGTAFGNNTCADWTVADDGHLMTIGHPHAGAEMWTSRADPFPCSRKGRIYCFGVDLAEPVPPPNMPGRKAFISLGEVSGTRGIAALDEHCQREASNAGLTGSFAALVSTTSTSAAARFDLTGPPWVRRDGTPIVEQAANLSTGIDFTSTVDQHADGTPIQGWSSDLAMIGAYHPQYAAEERNCSNWTANGQAFAIRSAAQLWNNSVPDLIDCARGGRVICLER
jgi:hypothetical protein